MHTSSFCSNKLCHSRQLGFARRRGRQAVIQSAAPVRLLSCFKGNQYHHNIVSLCTNTNTHSSFAVQFSIPLVLFLLVCGCGSVSQKIAPNFHFASSAIHVQLRIFYRLGFSGLPRDVEEVLISSLCYWVSVEVVNLKL